MEHVVRLIESDDVATYINGYYTKFTEAVHSQDDWDCNSMLSLFLCNLHYSVPMGG